MAQYESRGFSSSMTAAQKRQAEAAIYGLAKQETEVANTSPLTHDEIERMRQIVLQHDSSHKGGLKEFDLNNPPKEPYQHQEFPRMVFDHSARKHKVVHNQAQLKAALEAGFELEAFSAEVEAPGLDPASAAEADAVDARLRSPKKK